MAQSPVFFKVDKPRIQADRLLCLIKLLVNSEFWESSSVHWHWHPIISLYLRCDLAEPGWNFEDKLRST